MIRIKNAAFGFVFKSNILIAALLFFTVETVCVPF